MQLMRVVVGTPDVQRPDECKRTGPVRQPETRVLDRTPHPLGVGMACRVVIAGTRPMEPQWMTGWPKGERSRRAPIVTHQGDLLTPRAVGALTVDRPIPCREPMPGCTRPAGVIAHDLCGLPVPDPHDRDPPAVLSQALGHVDAPPFVGLGRSGFAPGRRAFGPELRIGLDPHVRRPHQTPPPLLVGWQLLHAAPIRPNPAVALAGRRRRERLHTWEQRIVALGD
jgi:hypothetical protein